MKLAVILVASLMLTGISPQQALSHDLFAPMPGEEGTPPTILPEEIETVDDLLRIRFFQRSGMIAPIEEEFFSEEFGQPPEEDGVENVFLQSHKWPDRYHLKICFFDGTARERRAIMAAFDHVLDYTNLLASFHDGNCPIADGNGGTRADIQIMIHASTCGSTMGKTSLVRLASTEEDKGPNSPTMWLCGSTNFNNSKHRRVLLHEILHSLAFAHELQHLGKACWDHLDAEEVKKRLVSSLSAEEQEEWFRVNYRPVAESLSTAKLDMTAFDYDSVMLYPTERVFWKAGTPSICFDPTANTRLSNGDKDMLLRSYPQNATERMARSARLALRSDDGLLRQVIVASAPLEAKENAAIEDCLASPLCLDDLRTEIVEQLMPGPAIVADLSLVEEPSEQLNSGIIEAQAVVVEANRIPGDNHLPAPPRGGICRQIRWCSELLSEAFETMSGGPTTNHAALRDGLMQALQDDAGFATMLGIDQTSPTAGLTASAASDCLADDTCASKFRDTMVRALDLNGLGAFPDSGSLLRADEWDFAPDQNSICTGAWCSEIDRMLDLKTE